MAELSAIELALLASKMEKLTKENELLKADNAVLQAKWGLQGMMIQRIHEANKPKPIEDWHEEDGDCLWWFFPIEEPPYCGNPLDSSFPDYVTHFTKFATPE